MLAPATKTRRFQLILIKPSHYDDEGYVVQWLRSSIPANSLACVYTLAADAAARQVLGTEVEIDIIASDETNSRVKPRDIIARIRSHGGLGLVGLVGVQSNQFPRALDIARSLRAARSSRTCRSPSTWDAACSPERRKTAAWTACCRMPRAAR